MLLLPHGAFPLSLRNNKPRIKRFFDELASDSRIDDSERAFVVNVFYRAVDIAVTQIEVRFQGMRMVAEKFNFFVSRKLCETGCRTN